MGRSWAAVREPVAAGTLRANDKGLVDVIFRWEQLLRSRASCIPSLLMPLTTGFPAVAPPKRMARVCQAAQDTWWFSADGSGRFDLTPPYGTCYLATDAYAAIREATRLGPVSNMWVPARELREVVAPDPNARLAATTHRATGRHGVTTELATIVP